MLFSIPGRSVYLLGVMDALTAKMLDMTPDMLLLDTVLTEHRPLLVLCNLLSHLAMNDGTQSNTTIATHIGNCP